MKKLVVFIVIALFAMPLIAAPSGWVDSERFGYQGTITRYSDSSLTTQVGDVIQMVCPLFMYQLL